MFYPIVMFCEWLVFVQFGTYFHENGISKHHILYDLKPFKKQLTHNVKKCRIKVVYLNVVELEKYDKLKCVLPISNLCILIHYTLSLWQNQLYLLSMMLKTIILISEFSLQ